MLAEFCCVAPLKRPSFPFYIKVKLAFPGAVAGMRQTSLAWRIATECDRYVVQRAALGHAGYDPPHGRGSPVRGVKRALTSGR